MTHARKNPLQRKPRRCQRLLLLAATTVILGVLVPSLAPAQATAHGSVGSDVAQAARSFARSPVYVADDTSGQMRAEIDVSTLTTAITSGHTPIYIAVLPDSAARSSSTLGDLPAQLAEATGKPDATYIAVLLHATFVASGVLPEGQAAMLLNRAFATRRPGESATDVLVDVVHRIQNAQADVAAQNRPLNSLSWYQLHRRSIGAGSLLVVVALLLAAFELRRRRTRPLPYSTTAQAPSVAAGQTNPVASDPSSTAAPPTTSSHAASDEPPARRTFKSRTVR